MTSDEMVKYRRTDDMESLYLMLANEGSIYENWYGFIVRLARKAVCGDKVNYEKLANECCKKIVPSLDRLCVRHHKICEEWLQVTDEQKVLLHGNGSITR